MVSWMSMNRIDQYPGRGSGNSCLAQKKPVKVTPAPASQLITPMLRPEATPQSRGQPRPPRPAKSAEYPRR
jgi:hypothetical protein